MYMCVCGGEGRRKESGHIRQFGQPRAPPTLFNLEVVVFVIGQNKAEWEGGGGAAELTAISSHHCQVLLPRHPHPHSNQCAHTALK